MSSVATKPSGASAASAKGNVDESAKRGNRVRDPNLPVLTPTQKIARQQVQSAQNACKFIKDFIDQGNMVSGEVLSACSTLTGALGGMIGE